MEYIDWGNLPFSYIRTDYNVRCSYRNGQWGEIVISSEDSINLSIAATCLLYGQEAFEAGMAINMGQILSIPFVIWGIYLIFNSNKQSATVLNGKQGSYKR